MPAVGLAERLAESTIVQVLNAVRTCCSPSAAAELPALQPPPAAQGPWGCPCALLASAGRASCATVCPRRAAGWDALPLSPIPSPISCLPFAVQAVSSQTVNGTQKAKPVIP